MQAAFHTFGCRLNQLETEALADSFKQAGFPVVPLSREAQIFIINTCTVTSKSEQKARGLIRKKSRENPSSIIIVTGCYAQMEEPIINELGPNVFAVPLGDKDLIQDYALSLMPMDRVDLEGKGLLSYTKEWFRDNHRTGDAGQGRFRFVPEDFTYHTRAYLKIQDGCDNSCAYCRVTLARGASVSLELNKVLERAVKLEEQGFSEVTLTGVNIDSYRSTEVNLAGLLGEILDNTKHIRIRLSSLDPDTFTPDLARAVAHERVCPYFHLSVQSGSDHVLTAMNRRYSAEQVLQAVELLRETRDNPFISCDIIVGFPGESEENFQETLSLMGKANFARAHVFPYSPRPGTPAFDRKDSLKQEIITRRASQLRELMAQSQILYTQSWSGKNLEVVWEKKEGNLFLGLSGNYLTCVRQALEKEKHVPSNREIVFVESFDRKKKVLICRTIKYIKKLNNYGKICP
jgi:threonylcarbamoyladenosine tRNA methylthiotransferase MtaB